MSRYFARSVLLLSCLFMLSCGKQDSGSQNLMLPDQTVVALTQAATELPRNLPAALKGDVPTEIPKNHWPAAVAKMNPICVYYDRVNLAIVTEVKNNQEVGYYIIPAISSYMPTYGESSFTTLTPLPNDPLDATGEVYVFVR